MLINGKTPEEIKQTLAICGSGACDVRRCPHAAKRDCSEYAMRDAFLLIERLEQLLTVLGVSIPKEARDGTE